MKDVADKSAIRRLNVFSEDIKCKPGCSACCNRQIYLTVAEAIVIQEYLEKSGEWPAVEQRSRALLKLARDTSPISWFKMNLMCPILDPASKMCTAYTTRPSPCSIHFVKSDPKQCDPWTTAGSKYEPIDFKDLHDEFQKVLEKTVDGYGILALKFPLPIALVFAARAKKISGIGPNELVNLIFNELS